MTAADRNHTADTRWVIPEWAVAGTPDTPTDSDTAARARALLDAATPGPWTHDGWTSVWGPSGDLVVGDGDIDLMAHLHGSNCLHDGALIAAAPTLITDLLAERDAAVARAEHWERLFRDHLADRGADEPCNCGWGGVHDPDNPRCDRNIAIAAALDRGTDR